MLGQRIITAIVLLSALLLMVFFTNALMFSLVLTLVTLLGAWEWTRLANIKSLFGRSLYCLAFVVGCALIYISLKNNIIVVLNASLLFWLLALFLICTYPHYNNYWNKLSVLGLMGFLVLIPCWLVMLHIRSQDDFAFNFLSLIVLVAAADVGAYFSGRNFGKHKLAELVSPNKTWEGVIGGLAACFLIVIILFVPKSFLQDESINWFLLIVLPLLVSSFSVIGDLFESMLKRVRGLKDSGNILPGHGGILDRIDGIVSTTPIYMLILLYLN
jgi:phosphatidate cytidylyltransferase